jgi:hypothetical protein
MNRNPKGRFAETQRTQRRELKHGGTERTEEHGEQKMCSPSIFIIRELSIDGILTRGKRKKNRRTSPPNRFASPCTERGSPESRRVSQVVS